MAINKVGSKGIEDGAVAVADFKDGDITGDKLNSTLDLSSNTVTLPNTSVTNAQLAGSIANDKLSNSSITASGTSISLGGSTTFNNKFTDWQSVITGDTTMVSGRGYFVDTSSSTVTMTLPSSASIGDFVAIKDYAGTFNTNNLTIARNGHNIQGEAVNSLITTNRASLVLVYVDSTKGWLYWEEHNVGDLEENVFVSATGGTVATSGDFKIHTFTGDGCFVVSAGLGPVSVVDYLVVAGGGAGGGVMGGGGGAGGYRESHSTPVSGSYTASPLATPTGIPVSAQTYPITVGAGGSSAGPGAGYPAGSGTGGANSVFSTITSAGGGAHSNGVSGKGGSGAGYPRYTGTGAAGNTPPVSPPQGQPGGDVPSRPSHQDNIAGGGGGAGQAGGDANSDPYPTPSVFRAGPGGNGVASEISGSSVTRAGGGGGGSRTGSPTHYAPSGATGGSGGGGVGGHSPNAAQCNGVAGTPGSANTGGGGGGGLYHAPNLPAPFPQMPGQQDRDMPGGNGGKGIVIIRYKFQ